MHDAVFLGMCVTMKLAAFIVCLTTFVGQVSSGGLIIERLKPEQSTIFEITIDILESCYANRISTVGLVGSSIEEFIKATTLRDTVMPVTMTDNSSRIVIRDPVDGASRHKLQVFVLVVNNSSDLAQNLIRARNSKWWNNMAISLIINGPEVANECANAHEMLLETWKMDIINSIFLCRHRTRGTLIYTFNPYTSKAPVPWQQENTYEGIDGHVWTLFVQQYRIDKSRCDALDFDKTIDLGGYKIRASVKGMENWWNVDPSIKPTVKNLIENITARILTDSLNATWKFTLHAEDGRAPRDEKGNPIGVTAEVVNGSSDICLNLLNEHVWARYEITYPNYVSSLAVVTQYPGHKSQLDKLISVLDRSSRLCTCVVLLITLLFFKYHLRESLIPAMLNLVLILCNAALRKVPEKWAPRIYLGSLFLLVVTIQGIYQGQFSSLLTTEVRLPNVNSVEDLAQSDYTIYGDTCWRHFFGQSSFDGRYVVKRGYSCTSSVLQNSKGACAGEKVSLIREATEHQLHLSREPMGDIHGVYLIRPDWPLKDRVNKIYARAKTGDIMRPLYTRELHKEINILESYENNGQDQGPKPLTLAQLRFAFVILVIGLSCATISFIIEVATNCTPIDNLRRCIRRRIPRQTFFGRLPATARHAY